MNELELAIKKGLAYEDFNKYKPYFSPSSLPFCPRKYVIYECGTEDVEAFYSWKYSGEFYTTIGHAIHSSTQKQLGKSGLLFGNWSCCGITRQHQYSSACPICNKWPEYSEYRLDKQLNGIGGFVDGVIPAYKAVLEIKTKSTKYIQNMTEPIWYEWSLQASVYVTALKNMYNYDLDKIAMLYISRENPNVYKIFVVKAIKTSLQGQLDSFEYGKKCVKLKVLPNGICSSIKEGEEKYCIYTPICFRPDLAEKFGLASPDDVKVE